MVDDPNSSPNLNLDGNTPKVNRPWFDLHPKVAAGFVMVVLLVILSGLTAWLIPDFFLDVKELVLTAIGGFLVAMVAYFKPDDGK